MTAMKPATTALKRLKVATEVWIATALLHQEQPEREDWTIEEIVRRVEKLHSTVRAGLRAHVTLHCVANRKPNPARLRMLYATSKSGRRLNKPGDPCEEGHTGPTHPERGETPTKYHPLLDWYENEYAKPAEGGRTTGCGVYTRWTGWAKASGLVWIRTSMFANCARAGIEPGFLRYKHLHLPVGRLWRTNEQGASIARTHARAPRRSSNLHHDCGRSDGKAVKPRRHRLGIPLRVGLSFAWLGGLALRPPHAHDGTGPFGPVKE